MSDSPDVFTTPSLQLATWLDYARLPQLRFSRYDAETRLFYFWDPDHKAQAIIDRFHKVDPTVNLHRFERTRKRMTSTKLNADGRLKSVRRKEAGAE